MLICAEFKPTRNMRGKIGLCTGVLRMGRGLFNGRARGRAAALVGIAVVLGVSLKPQTMDFAQSARAETPRASVAVEPDDTLELTGLQRKFEAIAKRVGNGVVAISASATRMDSDDVLRSEEMNSEKLENILDRTTRTVGTGFFIDSEGCILTNEHVVGDSEQLWVTTEDHKVYPAIVIGSDPRTDLAVLKIPARSTPACRFAEFDSVQRGQWTIALGNPYGLATDGEMCMSVGVVSGLNKSLPKLASKENRLYTNLIQTTAQINPGNSGGPLFDLNGDVIGINTAVILPQKQTNGIGFALPITPQLLGVVRQIKEGREVVYGYLGVTVATPTARERARAGLREELGARIDYIEADSPASGSTLRVDDVVVQIDGQLVQDSDQFVRVIGTASVERPVQLNVYRDGKAATVSVMLRRRQLPSVAVTRENRRLRWRGMLLGPIPANWEVAAASGKPASGLLVLGVEADSPASKEGIKAGSIITAVAGRAVADVTQLQRIINDQPAGKCRIETLGAGTASAVVSFEH